MSMNQLNDDCLFLILDRVPLMDLILRVSLVSFKWNLLQNNLCIRKQNLALACSINAVPTKPHRIICKYRNTNDYLLINILTGKVCQAIRNRFPKIYRFEFIHVNFFLPNFLKLLNYWRCHLRNLKIKIMDSAVRPPNSDWNGLFTYLEQNDFTSLHHLTAYTEIAKGVPVCKLPNLPHLEELYIGYQLEDWEQEIQVVNSNWKNLKRFGYSYGFSLKEELREIPQRPGEWYTFYDYRPQCKLQPHITNQLTHYSFGYAFEWSEFSTPGTAISLDLLLTRFELHLLLHLRFLGVLNQYDMNTADGKMAKPIELIPSPLSKSTVFTNLETLEIIYPPHGVIVWEQIEMPKLKVIELFAHHNYSVLKRLWCKLCFPTEDYRKCHQLFISSILTWKNMINIYYDSKLYTCT